MAPDGGNSAGVIGMLESALWEDKQQLERDKELFLQQRQHFTEERKNFTEAAIRLWQDVSVAYMLYSGIAKPFFSRPNMSMF